MESPPSSRFNFSPKIISPIVSESGVNTLSSDSIATYKAGNYFRFPDIETPPSTTMTTMEVIAATENIDDQIVDVPMDVTTKNLNIESTISRDKESIILKIDEVESPTPEEEEKSPLIVSSSTSTTNASDDKGEIRF